ncbi:MAG TPA: haloalkane dehalogenase [Nevskiaceae bacterium]|nr:haloalkane dehalogenase [Nevskiaceae bacterium]
MPRVAPHPKATATVLGRRMAYVAMGEGAPILFLHGNPTSSYLWRDVMPEVASLGRCVAPDLIGMGDSEKLDGRYTFDLHSRHVDAFIDTVIGPDAPLVLVLHDWGSALGFDWARRHPARVRGIAYMEGIVRPFADWNEWNADSARIFQGFRSERGEELILDRNLFIEKVLPGSILRPLSAAEHDEYRRPFLQREDRRPTLDWPRSIPVGGEPPDVVARVADYAAFMAASPFPKLFVNAEPGAILVGAVRDFCRSWPNQREVTVRGSHFVQEDAGPEIGRAVADWVRGL